MRNKKNKTGQELSYYGFSLLSYLKENYPHRTGDTTFIEERADAGAKTYCNAVKNGQTHIEAEELASIALFQGLHFSAYNTLVHILWNEFSAEIPEERAKEIALQILPLCSEVLDKYTLTDDFESTSQYDELYTELTGTVEILLEDGLQ
ncbi:DUF1896 family protein [Maribellus sp. YY47]|uniref:DUF1896 family protein n=1 Tax=Maribellus sp. YY47 TaxID=2929486 RepID=UPI0020014204|nr:DUF1896 family protein [Maribellus sp. YY47]MCK3683071.1 DUF1896 domain-containing protein [Maribellus sp. YY47]